MTSTETIASWIAHDGDADPHALAVALADPSPEIDAWLAIQERAGLFFLPAGFVPRGRVAVRRWLLLEAVGYALFCDADPAWLLPADDIADRESLRGRFDREAIGNEEFDVLARWLCHPGLFSDEEALRRTADEVDHAGRYGRRRWSVDFELNLVTVLASRGAHAAAFDRCALLVDEHPERVEELRQGLSGEALVSIFGGRHAIEAVGRSPRDTTAVLRMARLFIAALADPTTIDGCAELLAWAPVWDDCGAHCDMVGALVAHHGVAALPPLIAAYVHQSSELGDSAAGERILQACMQHRAAVDACLEAGPPSWCERDHVREADLRELLEGAPESTAYGWSGVRQIARTPSGNSWSSP